MEGTGVIQKLMCIQAELKAPKSQYNTFGKYAYRSCEDILEALKPILLKYKAAVRIVDDIVQIGDRYYVKATATLMDADTGETVETSAMAREDETKKGMDAAQVTGSTSSYARKYALNGLFAIDDTKDSDSTNNGNTAPEKPKEYKCCDCGKPFQAFTDKNGKTWNAGQVYHMSESRNTDGKARCSECMKKAGTEKAKETSNG